MRISDWSSDVCSSDLLYLDMIASAKRFIYFENQYFSCGKIAAAIAERLEEDDPPEFVVVMPETADGWLEQKAMDGARVKLVRAIAKARHGDRLRRYVPRTAAGEAIYVHAKTAVERKIAVSGKRLLYSGIFDSCRTIKKKK